MNVENGNGPNGLWTPSFDGFRRSLKAFFLNVFSISGEVDQSEAIEGIRKDVEFQGFNVWILFCSVLICSIGLNLNSTAVVIGAMLISPLMGPLVGTGFSVATFDRELLLKSLRNLANAVLISLLASFLFFSIAPTSHDQSELLARTRPHLLDLLVALFGGFAGILAATRRIKTNVIPGVAIATALMPPLCTAGYALSQSNWSFFLGASYLFFINSVMISLSALLVVWYLRFPKKTYVNMRVRKRVRNGIILFVTAVTVPSAILYARAIRETLFYRKASHFIDKSINGPDRKVFDPEINYGIDSCSIRLFVYGKPFSQTQMDSMQRVLPEFGLARTSLRIVNMGSLEESMRRVQAQDAQISDRQEMINELRFQLEKKELDAEELTSRLRSIESQLIDFNHLNREAQLLYPEIDHISYHLAMQSADSIDPMPVFLLQFKSGLSAKDRLELYRKAGNWLKIKYEAEFDTLQVRMIDAADRFGS